LTNSKESNAAIVQKHLFVDDRFVHERSSLERAFGEPTKCAANPVIRASEPWEKDAAFVDTGLVVYDHSDGLFKAWYQGGGCYGPEDGSLMCYAFSSDGVSWEKPSLGIVELNGSKGNNAVLRAQCMMHDPAPIIDLLDPDPERRYKAIWWGGRRDESQKGGWLLGHCVGFSPDGIHWTEHPDNPVWTGDAEVAIPFDIERRTGRLVMYSSADGYGCRVVARTESDDFVNWDLPPKIVFQPDEDDVPGTEIGCFCAVDYHGTQMGFLSVVRNLPAFTRQEWQEIIERNIRQGFFGPPIELNATRCRAIYTEIVSSTDGVDWQRVHRRPYIPMGAVGSWDEMYVLAARPIVANDRIYIYYTGQGRTKQTPEAPPERIGQWNIDTGLATLRLDGFAALEADESGGMLETKPFVIEGTDLAINVDAAGGSVFAELIGEDGRPIRGFAHKDARVITGDHLRSLAGWRDHPDVRSVRGRTVSLRLRAKKCSLYSISILDSAKH